MSEFSQAPYDVRFDWGLSGLAALRECASFVIVDVLSFSTCVSIAVDRGAAVLPFRWDAEAARVFASEQGAVLAARRSEPGAYSLSPQSLLSLPEGTRLVLPSPNGSTLATVAASMGSVIAGCFRNRSAAAQFAATTRSPVAVIAAGEKWSDGSIRPCLEDLCGAGAIIAALPGSCSPEASAAAAAFSAMGSQVEERLLDCASGRELVERGFAEDVRLAAALDVSSSVPTLCAGVFVRAAAT
ncbi:MAG: 2-phosphosulfolactate phosphatase [Polyangiaceae bacterium]